MSTVPFCPPLHGLQPSCISASQDRPAQVPARTRAVYLEHVASDASNTRDLSAPKRDLEDVGALTHIGPEARNAGGFPSGNRNFSKFFNPRNLLLNAKDRVESQNTSFLKQDSCACGQKYPNMRIMACKKPATFARHKPLRERTICLM